MFKKILITGASGLCGSVLSIGLKKLGYKIISCDISSNPSAAARSLKIFTNQKIKILDLRIMKQVMRATKGVSAVIQPAGSIRDEEIIKFANSTDTILVFSKTRHFRH